VTIRDTFGLPALTGELTTDEGKCWAPYLDTKGILTVGIGRNLGKGLSDDEIDLMFANDVTECCRDLDAHAVWWRNLSPSKQRVMINLTFNMGWPVLSQFERFLTAMHLGNWPEAATQLRSSKWYSEVGTRGTRVVERLLAEPGAVA
jgi:lysozyme